MKTMRKLFERKEMQKQLGVQRHRVNFAISEIIVKFSDDYSSLPESADNVRLR